EALVAVSGGYLLTIPVVAAQYRRRLKAELAAPAGERSAAGAEAQPESAAEARAAAVKPD
ncbi:MAG: CDP-diacylglycerol--serine O-phosphatidyltransferase, partial [Thermoleophilia bacterium]|nr:CDP-diacylglycerol--serine O-phosphatidyltransferase [Thermoleophilia bacterium]